MDYHNFNKLVLLILVFSFGLQCSTDQASPEMLKVKFQETLRLGADNPEAPLYETFRMVTHTEIDEEGRLYVVDSSVATVRVYNENGEFLYTIGSPGEGPGEFGRISSLTIDSQKRLLVLDSSQGLVKAFSLDGNLLTTWELPSITQVHQLAEMPDGRFVLVGNHNQHLVHVVEHDFSRIQSSFVHVEDVLNTNTRQERVLLQFFSGSVTVLSDDVIIYAPPLYKGKLLVYSQNGDDSWHLRETFQGYNRHTIPASITTFDKANRVDVPLIFPGEGRYALQFHSASQGIFQLDDETLIHFSIQESNDNELELLSEHFDTDGEFLGFTLIQNMPAMNVTVLNMDSKGNIYLSDTQEISQLSRLTMYDRKEEL